MSYIVCEVPSYDRRTRAQVVSLLAREDLTLDAHLDYTCAVLDDDGDVIATGSCFASSLRCFAVEKEHQGEGLLNTVVSHLIEVQAARGNFHLFLYTKPKSARFFADLGFYEIVRLDSTLVFMENRRSGFASFCQRLAGTRRVGSAAAIVMNANPFTLGHRYLVEQAAKEYVTVYLFVLSEDASLFPADVRYNLVQEGVKDLPNVVLHRTEDYLISAATFPSYFLHDSKSAICASARLDLALFVKIAAALGVTARFVGEEPTSVVTGLYNEIMAQELPKAGIRCVIVPRLEKDGRIVSASSVRQAIHDGDMEAARAMLPPSTWAYLTSPEAVNVLDAIRASDEVIHY